MKKKIVCGLAVGVLLIGAFVSGHYAGAASKTPGSTGDPLITLSYLEERLAGLAGTEQVQLKKGQILTGETGTGIVIVRGSVTAFGENLADLTEGKGTEEDTSLFLYHSYLVAEDGSGCEALSGCTLLVSGKYEIKSK